MSKDRFRRALELQQQLELDFTKGLLSCAWCADAQDARYRNTLDSVLSRFDPEAITDPELREIYYAVARLWASTRPATAYTVADELPAETYAVIEAKQWVRHVTETVGAVNFAIIGQLFEDGRWHWMHLTHYADQLHKAWIRRKAALGLDVASETLRENQGDPAELIEPIIADAAESVYQSDDGRDPFSVKQAIMDVVDATPIPRISTGISSLDDMLGGGFHGGQVVTIGARTSCGKTSLGVHLACFNVFERQRKVLYCSLEVTPAEMVQKIIAWQRFADLDSRPGQDIDELTAANRLNAAAGGTSAEQLLFLETDPRRNTLAGIQRQVRTLAGSGLALVVVDYLQLLPLGRKVQNREQEVATLTRSLKLLAMECDVPIIIGSQINRAGDENNPPTLSMLRESGSIEQDSNVVLLLHQSPEDRQLGSVDLRVSVAKNRSGAAGTLAVRWDKQANGFTSKLLVKPSSDFVEWNDGF